MPCTTHTMRPAPKWHKGQSEEVPLHLRNAPTTLMKAMDHGAGYRYAHDEPEAYAAGENYFPEALQNRQYYLPSGPRSGAKN